YLAVSFNFFRRARGDCAVLLRQCEARGWRRVALYGAGDLAEIAVLSAGETAVEIVCVIDSRPAGRRFARLPGVADLAAAQLADRPGRIDVVILTDTEAPQQRFDELLVSAAECGYDADAIAVPDLLGVSLASARQEAAQ